jgi:hypothetical protein
MLFFNGFSLSQSCLLPVPPLEKSPTPDTTQQTKTTKVPVYMIWVKEFDGERERLVAHWVKQD